MLIISTMMLLMFIAVCLLPSEGFSDKSNQVNLVGEYEGVAQFNEFIVDESKPLGGDSTIFTQRNVFDIQEQNGTFFRGMEYYYYNNEKVFVANVFGVVSVLPFHGNLWRFRMQEYFNKVDSSGDHEQVETLGIFDGTLNADAMSIDLMYTGVTLNAQKFAATQVTIQKV
jgi:hypothetical protein